MVWVHSYKHHLGLQDTPVDVALLIQNAETNDSLVIFTMYFWLLVP